MTVLSAMQSAAVRLIGQRPDSFFGAAPNAVFQMEIADLVSEVAADVMKSHDWQALTKVHTVAGDGTATAFALPVDYDRMLVKTDLQDPVNWAWGYRRAGDLNEFLAVEARGFVSGAGIWLVYGDEMRFSPAPGGNAQFPYISRNVAKGSGTMAGKPAFDADTDVSVLPERLLTLGLIWRWRENKKMDFTGDQEAFTKAIGEHAAKDGGSRLHARNSRRSFPGTYPAWPGSLG